MSIVFKRHPLAAAHAETTTGFKLSILSAITAALIAASAQAATTEEKVEILTQEVERLKTEIDKQKQQEPAVDRGGQYVAPHGSASEARVVPHGAGSAGQTRVGGYGELHYNNLDSKKEIDFHRFILFLGHNFTDRIRFFSELELEHSVAGEGEKGELELEQAFLEFDLTDKHRAQAGLFVIPVGILNETHEPPTFYGVERNPVETNIIPTTWWEGGAGLKGELAPGWGYDLAVSSGLDVPTNGSNAFKIRNGRQNVAEAKANGLAYTGRVKWTGAPGVELAATLQYQDDVTQDAAVPAVSATLAESHAIVSRGPFTVKALYAQWNLDGSGPKAVGRDKQKGWYVEPSYKLTPKLGVFARYNEWDNEAGDATASKKKQTDFGINYWPHERVVLKADIQRQSGAANDDGFNLGVGYMF